MVPKISYFLDKFPLTPIGKIDKKELRKMFSQGILTI
jgi:fatty-acyl-CoA synthase/long-chain acyl-CoA synthetase